MSNKKHLKILKEGTQSWNAWKEGNPKVRPNLRGAELRQARLEGANLIGADLGGANLKRADLRGAHLSEARLAGADLTEVNLSSARISGTILTNAKLCSANLTLARASESDLSEADLSDASLRRADLTAARISGGNLREADLSESVLSGADLSRADLTKADLSYSDLRGTNLISANLSQANLTGAYIGGTTFGNNDLSTVEGLEDVRHLGPSTIGIDTLFKSDGKIPDEFLREAGIPEDFIIFVPSLVGRAIEFYSCFISYSHRDEEFAQRLHSRMRHEKLRVWFAPEDLKGGRKLHEEIFQAIQVHDKLLLVLSEGSMKSEWVSTEIRRARKVEREENRRKLFPIRLVDFEAIQKWECFNADDGKDLAVELREYYIPDFSNWKDHDSFEAEFKKLLRDLRATET